MILRKKTIHRSIFAKKLIFGVISILYFYSNTKLKLIMKFLRFSVFAIVVLGMVGLFSCGDDTVTPPTNAQKIEGTWLITATEGSAEKLDPVTATEKIADATASLKLEASTATGLTYTLTTANVATFTGGAGTINDDSFELNSTGTSATIGTTVVTISQSPISGGTGLVLTYSIPEAVSQNTEYKSFSTIKLTMVKE
ncbi:MAG: hypothetical protein ACI85I_000588 [Arenicella sp.]